MKKTRPLAFCCTLLLAAAALFISANRAWVGCLQNRKPIDEASRCVFAHDTMGSGAIGDHPLLPQVQEHAMPAALPKASRPSRQESQAMAREPRESSQPMPVSS